MALALLFEDTSVLYLDAVTNFTKSYSSRLSQHPIDKSANVTHHVAKDNPTYSIKGVISAADFHNFRAPLEGSVIGNYQSPVESPVSLTEIITQDSSMSMLPGSIQQFLSSTDETQVTTDNFRGYIHQAARDRLESAWENSEVISILDYDFDISTGRSSAVRLKKDLLIQNLTDNEEVMTGDSFDFTITFQKARFAFLKETDINVTAVEVADSASGETNNGNQSDGTVEDELLNLWNGTYKPALRYLGVNL